VLHTHPIVLFKILPINVALLVPTITLVPHDLLLVMYPQVLHPCFHNSELWNSSYNGDLEKTRRLLDNDIDDIELPGGAGLTPLLAAACNGFDDVVDLLLQRGADPLSTTFEGFTLLHVISSSRKANGRGTGMTMRYILASAITDKRIDINARTDDGETPLSRAVATGTLDSVQQLLASNADTSLVDKEGRTPLHQSTRIGDNDKSRLLISYMTKSAIDMQDICGDTALHNAAGYGRDPPGATVFARRPARISIVELFIATGANVSLENSIGETARDAAVAKGRVHVARILEEETTRRAVLETVYMGLHPRLGNLSRFFELDPGVVQMIAQSL
jgi:ankyrin repeat protein